uniref:Cyclin-dependent protein kinase inhibitor SMR3 n=1 Tax=Salix viminalis TaxID=40686 RepID=A0A6N2K616_SALVM
MFSELKSLSLMELSTSEMFFSEKDLNPSMEFNFLVRSALELGDDRENEPQELHKEKEVEEEEEQEDDCEVSVPTLKIKLPSVEAFQIEDDKDDDDDGFKTPTSLDRKIPVIFQCPPATRKPKSLPSTKRKSGQRRVLLDLSNEIESLFPPAPAGDLGGKLKKVRHGNDAE